MKNIKNIKKVLDHIEANPHLWKQNDWHCGTSHCFAGWAEVFATGEKEDNNNTRKIARMYFGFNQREANYYFKGNLTLEELKTALEPFFDEEGWGMDGLNIEGYDREGYNYYGYNKEGYNRAGHKCRLYNSEAYDQFGYDREGYDTDGLDKNNNPKPVNN